MQVLVLVGALAVLTLGAESLVRGSVALAKRLGLSSFFIGLTIVGFGTSTPELCTSLAAAWRGQSSIAVGNVVGSNIFNIAVILGLTALICPIPVKLSLVRKEVLLVIVAAALPWGAAATNGVMTRWQGALMVAGLMVYLWRGYAAGKREGGAEAAALEAELERELGASPRGDKGMSARRTVVAALMVGAGLALLVGGSVFFVRSATEIARGAGVSELVIGLTIVAAGTSAPEVVTSVVAALRRQSDIAVGNILGSNLFNVLGILGVTSVVAPQAVERQALVLDVPVMVAASIALLPIVMSHARISRAEGVVLLAGYGAYLWVLFAWAPGWFG